MADLFETFHQELLNLRGTSSLDRKLVKMLADLQKEMGKPELSAKAQMVLLVYFSLLGDGNTCIPLEPKKLFEKWQHKWDGLVASAEARFPSEKKFSAAEKFQKDLEKGAKDLLSLPRDSNGKLGNLPLVIESHKDVPWLFAEKYWNAKNVLRERFIDEGTENASKKLFTSLPAVSEEEIQDCICEVKSWSNNIQLNFKLKSAQARAVLCGQDHNLIVTGGPGTGKTTVVQFLLWKLFKKDSEKRNWALFFVAPSGKAANRLKEIGRLADIFEKEKNQHPDIAKKFDKVEGMTLHRLLRFNPSKNAFTYNEKNPLPENSIFVVDEASMIDICLFASFLKALPQNSENFRLFILGDKDQLPSVDAGAVLGELLIARKDAVVELTESNRFPQNSAVGCFAASIQKEDPDFETALEACGGVKRWSSAEENFTFPWPPTQDSVCFVDLAENKNLTEMKKKKDVENRLNGMLGDWTKAFCAELPNLASQVHPEGKEDDLAARKALWEMAESARILSAERHGLWGVESINQKICEKLKEKSNAKSLHFPGQILMFTRNQAQFQLFNGDTGVVVKDANGAEYLMMKAGEDFRFYPLSLFSGDILETAFAMTVHKSQGSGYRHILLFLPRMSGHPLLNRQILYTGVTRVQMGKEENPGCLTVVASKCILEEAKKTKIVRDSGIFL